MNIGMHIINECVKCNYVTEAQGTKQGQIEGVIVYILTNIYFLISLNHYEND